jgi:hypothetical protein
MVYIIESKKKGIRAISGSNSSVEFHNRLFDTDDCVVTWEDDPTPEEITRMRETEVQEIEEFDAANRKRMAYMGKSDPLFLEYLALEALDHPDAEAKKTEWLAMRARVNKAFEE